jgi:hypothetical protein
VKQLLVILIVATVVFMGLAMAQEWEIFAPLFFSSEAPPAAPEGSPDEVRGTIEQFNTILEHLYRYGGDERFLLRLPASDTVKAEIQADIDYLAASGIHQMMEQLELSFISESGLAEGVHEVVTEEEWRIRYLDLDGTPLGAAPMSFVVTLRYVVRKMDAGWQVAVMEPAAGG